jgi:hypothetical protein
MTRSVLSLVLYEFRHVGNLVLAFEGRPFSKVMGNDFARFWNSGQKAVGILVTFHFDLPVVVS